ncbi:MAG TPA: PilZ domain-containing protein [Candidatus Binatia bacterium]|nr:PilZ domain-containing protein [Candidatus Binatia bacterium]
MPASTPKPSAAPVDRRRRRHVRYRADFRVSVACLAGSEYHKVEGHCRDLSEAGIGILFAAELKTGDVVSLTFSLPGGSTWQLRGVVRYRHGYHYGFEFLSLPAEQREQIKQYLKELQPAP